LNLKMKVVFSHDDLNLDEIRVRPGRGIPRSHFSPHLGSAFRTRSHSALSPPLVSCRLRGEKGRGGSACYFFPWRIENNNMDPDDLWEKKVSQYCDKGQSLRAAIWVVGTILGLWSPMLSPTLPRPWKRDSVNTADLLDFDVVEPWLSSRLHRSSFPGGYGVLCSGGPAGFCT